MLAGPLSLCLRQSAGPKCKRILTQHGNSWTAQDHCPDLDKNSFARLGGSCLAWLTQTNKFQ
eukprot:4726157-Amphidinium_carterae.1